MGVLCLIKPHYGLFVLWALLRKEWRFAFACVAAGLVGLIGSVAVFGFANHLDYLPVLSHLAERGETYYPNHSVNGLLNRLMSVGEPELYRNLDWGDGAFPPFNRLGLLDDDHQLGRDPAAGAAAAQSRQRSGSRDRLLHHGGERHGRLPDRLGASLRRAVPGVRGRAGRRAAQPRPAALADRELRAREQLFHRDAATGADVLEFHPVLSLVRDLDPAGAAASAAAAAAGERGRFAADAISGHATRERDALFA